MQPLGQFFFSELQITKVTNLIDPPNLLKNEFAPSLPAAFERRRSLFAHPFDLH
jgi:hypothetical protein